MFAALVVRPQSPVIYKRVLEKIVYKKPDVVQTAVRNGAPFFTIYVSRRKGEIPWKDVEFYAGNCCERILLPDGIVPPKNSRVKKFTPQFLPQKVLFNTACELLSRSRQNPVGRVITLFDKNAVLAREVHRLVPFASSVRVITDSEEKYEEVSKRIMEEFGASLIVSDNVLTAEDSGFIISFEGVPDDFHPRKLCAVLCGKEQPSRGFIAVTGREMNLPSEYCRLVPKNIDRDNFACAIYEKCGVAVLSGLMYTRLHLFGADTTLCGAAKMLNSLNSG